jgi:hypothetical protein
MSDQKVSSAAATVALPLLLPVPIIGSLVGFHFLNLLMRTLQRAVSMLRTTDVPLLKDVLYQPATFFSSLLTSSFGTKFSPNATHVLLGALILVVLLKAR